MGGDGAIIADEKEEARRQFEMKRTAAANAVQSVKNEATNFGRPFLGEWGSNAELAKADQTLQSAEYELQAEQFEASQALSAKASEQYRNLYEQSVGNKKRFDSRQYIVAAIIEALNDLEYDAPDAKFVPVGGIENKKLGNITIFAKSKGEIGDMRLVIGLDGKLDLHPDIPEGKEAECHNAITSLQSRVAHIAKLTLTELGILDGYEPIETESIAKQKIQEKVDVQVKQKGI
jgi:hypothetical protein